MTQLPESSRRVEAAAKELDLAISIREMASSTRTAEEAAAACGATVGQIVKSLVFLGAQTSRPYLLLVSGKNRVNESGVAHHLGEPLKRPDAAKVRELTSYAIGGIPPFGHGTRLETYFDADLLAYDIVWAAAGTPHAVFSVNPHELQQRIGAKIISVA